MFRWLPMPQLSPGKGRRVANLIDLGGRKPKSRLRFRDHCIIFFTHKNCRGQVSLEIGTSWVYKAEAKWGKCVKILSREILFFCRFRCLLCTAEAHFPDFSRSQRFSENKREISRYRLHGPSKLKVCQFSEQFRKFGGTTSFIREQNAFNAARSSESVDNWQCPFQDRAKRV